MLKSLYSGVSGLQSHQVAMDVESNNIANVNTTGFKYSRANFSDLLAQTSSIATAPQGNLGGKNAVQIGLGSTINSQTRIFSQGSIQNSDKNTDVAIQGDGFFIISPDAGNTYKYTRAGDFKFDAAGNFVDNNGFVAQGWLRDPITGKVDATGSIESINIAPGLTTPASPSSEVVLKANLNSGILVKSFSPAYAVPSGTPPSKAVPPVFTGDAVDAAGAPIASGNMGVMFNDAGQALSLQTNQGVWASFLNSTTTGANGVAAGAASLDITFTLDDGSTQQVKAVAGAVGDTAAQNGGRFAAAINAQATITGVSAVYNASTNQITLVNDNSNADASHNINISAVGNTNSGLSVANKSTTAYKYQYSPNGAISLANSDKTFTTISDLRYAMEVQARAVEVITPATSGPYIVGAGTGLNEAADFTLNGQAIHVNAGGQVTENSVVTFGPLSAGQTLTLGGLTLTATNAMTNIEVADAFNGIANNTAAAAIPVPPNGTFSGTLTGWSTDNNLGNNTATFTSSTPITNVADLVISGTGSASNSLVKTDGKGATTADENGAIYAAAINNAGIAGVTAKYVSGTGLTISNTNKTSVDLVVVTGSQGVTGFPNAVAPGATTTILPGTIGNGDAVLNESNIAIKVNSQGKFEITNPGLSNDGDYDINLKITALKDKTAGITENTNFTTSMQALNAVLPAGTTGTAISQSFNAATHSSSIDIFDSLGSKHTLRMELRKTALDKSTGSTWDMKVSVPEPASINTVAPFNEKTGSVRFNNDGSLATYSPQNISFSGNNGSSPNQQVRIKFGSTNGFDGMTSFDAASSTSGIQQDGYTGGDLVGIRIDQSGTVVGSFSNGRSFGLAQIAMAKFTNNEGLATEGGNVYIQTANSGDPIIGTAASSGRGFIQSSALEASNVDLSRALTQLIIIQRGYQANGKTITTSDQLLQTLIGLKN